MNSTTRLMMVKAALLDPGAAANLATVFGGTGATIGQGAQGGNLRDMLGMGVRTDLTSLAGAAGGAGGGMLGGAGLGALVGALTRKPGMASSLTGLGAAGGSVLGGVAGGIGGARHGARMAAESAQQRHNPINKVLEYLRQKIGR